jgi:endonuclease/exonuclease/phosphatase family metal-dependent hydrolase
VNVYSRPSPAASWVDRPLRWSLALALLCLAPVGVAALINRLALPRPFASQGGVPGLRLLSWNIGRVHLRWESRAADRDLGFVAQVLRQVDPHVAALQELRDPTQLGRLLALLGHGWRGRVPLDAYDRRAALLWRVRGDPFEIPTSTGRAAQGAVLRFERGRVLTVVSLHLDAFDASRRLLQGQEILDAALRTAADDLVLAGDFNFDVAGVARDALDQRLYRLLTSTLRDGAVRAGATSLTARRIDYVFYRSAHWRVSDARVLWQEGIHGMDHRPLVVELEPVTPRPPH